MFVRFRAEISTYIPNCVNAADGVASKHNGSMASFDWWLVLINESLFCRLDPYYYLDGDCVRLF